MSSAQVAKLEALLARVHSRRLEPGLRLVDAPTGADAELDAAFDEPDTFPPPASASSLLTLDEPVAKAAAPAPVAAVPVAASAPSTRTTLDVDPDLDDLMELSSDTAPSEPEDALVTAVARPAPIMQLDEPVLPAPVAAAPAPVAAAPAPVPPSVVEAIPAPASQVQSAGPVVMHAPLPVASGPIASFVGTPPPQARSFGELVGLAMSLTTR